MRVIDIARRADVSPETVRYYTRLGLLTPTRDHRSLYRLFNEDDYTQWLFIRDARALGMSINDVQTVIKAAYESRVSHPEIVALFQARLGAVRQKIAALKPVERRLTQVLHEWQSLPRGAPTGRGISELIAAWPGGSRH